MIRNFRDAGKNLDDEAVSRGAWGAADLDAAVRPAVRTGAWHVARRRGLRRGITTQPDR